MNGARAEAAVRLEGVSKDFRQGGRTLHALRPLDFEARPGELIAILGPSGSGKSTLLAIMGGLQEPSGGTVRIGGRELSGLSEAQRARIRLDEVGFVLQSANLVPFLNVEEQIELYARSVRRPVDRARRDRLFEELDIARLRHAHPSDLSGGEQQRVAIARALYPDPAVVLADEPTASLDSERAFAVAALLAEQAGRRRKAIVMVTHDERLVPYCTAIYRMRDGVLRRANPPALRLRRGLGRLIGRGPGA